MIQPLGDFWIVLSGVSLWTGVYAHQKWLKWLSLSVFLVLAVGMITHWMPGFNNPLLLDQIRFSPDSIPFKMYLNIDKTVIGIFILLIYLRPFEPKKFRREDFIFCAKALAILVAVMMPLALFLAFGFKEILRGPQPIGRQRPAHAREQSLRTRQQPGFK